MSDRVFKPSASIEASHLERLRVNDLLIGLDDKDFAKFAKRCEFVPFAKGDILIEEGANQDCTFLIVEGKVRVAQGDESDVDIVFREIGEGGWFGEIAALDKGRRTASVHAMTDGVVVVMARAVFINLILEYRQIAVRVLESLAAVIRSTNQRFSEVSSFSGVQRVYLQLLELAEPDPLANGTWVINPMPSHEQLATRATTSKEAVARAISQIIQEGVAKRSRGKIRILDRESLKLLATQI